MNIRRFLFPLIVAALVTILAGCENREGANAEAQPPKVVHADLMTVGAEWVPGEHVVTGTVKALLNATLSSKVMGRVGSVWVREGDRFQRGQLLVSIDARELQAAVGVAGANYEATVVGVGSAATTAEMEGKTSRARISQAESAVRQAQAHLAAAEARRDLAVAGPRTQEVAQSHIAVVLAESNLRLAALELERTTKLVQEGALARRQLDLAQNRYDLAKGQLDAAVMSENIAREGTRSQDLRSAQEAVFQAQAALEQARSGVVQARAASMQVDVRRKDVELSRAQVKQAGAALRSAKVGLSYANVFAPFDGRVALRSADPGSMASPGVPLLTVEGGEYLFEAIVPEKLIKSLSMGDTATVLIAAADGTRIKGRVVEIAPQGDAVSHSFVVKFALGTGAGVKSGMFGKASIRTGEVNRMLIPATATWEREGLHYVFAVNREGIARLRIVTLGEAFDGSVEVRSGLGQGDRIVIGDRRLVTDGVKVETKGP